MDDTVEITRSIELDLDPDELWELIGDGERWAEWMVDTANIEVSPGASGAVTDGDEQRDVRIDEVDHGERVSFEWWPAGRRDQASSVELRIVPARHGSVLEIVETFPATVGLSASVALASWHSRVGVLATRDGCSSPREPTTTRRPVRCARRSDPASAARAIDPRRPADRHRAAPPESSVSRQAIVKHLQALTAVDLVAAERCGREVRYRATTEPLATVVDWLRGAERGVGPPGRAPAQPSYLTGRCSPRNAIVFDHAERAAASSWNIGASSSKACPAISTLRGK